MDRIVSLYWDNIGRRIVEAQRRVFAHFGLAVGQRERAGLQHDDFLDAYMAELGEDDVAQALHDQAVTAGIEIEISTYGRASRRSGASATSRSTESAPSIAAAYFTSSSRDERSTSSFCSRSPTRRSKDGESIRWLSPTGRCRCCCTTFGRARSDAGAKDYG